MDRVREVFGRPRSKPTKVVEVEETLRSEYFQVSKTVRHGFPYQPTAMAFDRVQNLLAIGTKTGSLRLFGKPGVECHIDHDGEPAILQILFLGNQGGMVTVCDDDCVHLWDIRMKHPTIAHTLKFQRERITYGHHPFQSKWLYLGTEKGNIHIIKTEDFVLSGYVINWNKAIELTRKTHPGSVVHLSDNPADPNKLLIGFECGAIVLWDLRSKVAEARFNASESMRSCYWHHEGKQFMCSHTDGSLTIWNTRMPPKPQNIIMPHAEIGKDGKPEPCRVISKVEWLSMRNDEPYIIFSGGMGYNQAGRSPSLTVMHGKNTTVLEMEHNVIDFISLASTPWTNDFQDPYGIIVLLQNDLVVVDLTSPGYPCFENPYPMDLHESPVTACQYIANCGTDLIPAFCSVGFKQKKSGYSPNEWPINGGECYPTTLSYSELIVTGHADGSLKFWDATAVTLQILYKLKTAKLFDKHKCHSPEGEEEDQDDFDPFAIQHLYMCAESRLLVVAGLTHVILFKFNQKEASVECPTLEVSVVYEIYDELDSPGVEYPPIPPKLSGVRHQSSNASEGKEKMTCVTTKTSSRKWSPGYQPELCILLSFIDGEPPPPITSLTVSSGHGLLAFGNDCGISVIDIIQKTCLLTMGTPDLYGSMDPYSRAPRSPKNKTTQSRQPQGFEGLSQNFTVDENKSPTQDQNPPEKILSPNVFKSPHSLETIREGSQHFFPNTSSASGLESIMEYPGKGQGQEQRESHNSLSGESHNSLAGFSEVDGDVNDNSFVLVPRPEPEGQGHPKVSDEEENDGQRESASASHPTAVDKSSENKNSKSINLKHTDVAEKNYCLRSDKPKCNESDKSLKQSESDQNVTSERSFNKQDSGSRQTASENDPEKPREEKNYCLRSEKPKEEQNYCMRSDKPSVDEEDGKKRRPSILRLFKKNKDRPDRSPDHRHPTLTVTASSTDTSREGQAGVKSGVSSDHLHSVVPETTERKYKSNPDLTTEKDAVDPPKISRVMSVPDGGHTEPQHKLRNFVRKVNRSLRYSMGMKEEEDSGKRKPHKIDIIDLTADDCPEKPPCRKMTYRSLHMSGQKARRSHPPELKRTKSQDKTDGSFSRSRSSSMSSLENISEEAIQCLVFANAYTRKSDSYPCPSLWVGTILGSVLVISISLPDRTDRTTQPVIVSPSGTIFRLKGAILAMSFLDCEGTLIPAVAEQWESKTSEGRKVVPRQASMSNMGKVRMSPTSAQEPSDRQLAILCSERHARVISLPSQTCPFQAKITDTSGVTKAEVITVKDSVCLSCYVANGHIIILSLPSLKPLMDVDYLPQPNAMNIRIAKTFCFSNNGHGLYFCSPTEVQKITFSADTSDKVKEMLPDLFKATDTPEAPKANFFKNLFTGGRPAALDREELFGEGSGKASIRVATYSPGSGQLPERVTSSMSEIARARRAALERGEKLGELDERTERMRNEAESYAHYARELKNKYKSKKWYQLKPV